ncbi:MAG: hypothetical protein CM15mP91_0300 [Chloroflexota bacterium]|nr:MAG: hypothetical protein CM15mP91_0300 [Chloroflexota bacterium]
MPGSYVNQSIIWSGNLWEEVHARTGEALNPWDAPSYAKDYPGLETHGKQFTQTRLSTLILITLLVCLTWNKQDLLD